MNWIRITNTILFGTLIIVTSTAQEPKISLDYTPLSFSTYLQEVTQSNLQLLAERKEIDQAEAEVIASKILPDPEISFEGTDETYSLELSFPLELGNKRGARLQIARSEAEKTQLNWDVFFQQLRAEAATAFVDALIERELMKIKKSSHHNMLQLSFSDSIRFTLGEITQNDARQSKLESTLLQNEIFQQEAELKSALIVLNQYMGKSVDKLYYPQGNWDHLTTDYKLSELLSIALQQRSDLKSIQKNNEVAHQLLKLIRAERKVDIELMVGYERNWKGVFPTRNSMKAGVSIPLKFSNLNKGALRAKQIATKRSLYDIQQTQLQIEVEVTQAFYQYEATKKKLKQYKSGLLNDSQKVLEGIIYKYKRGETSILDVLVAQRTYNEIQEHYLEVMKEFGYALIQLEFTSGIWTLNF